MAMSPPVLRALEELLRRVLRSPDHGIDPVAVSVSTHRQVVTLRARRRTRLALLLAGALALLLLGWFLHGWGVG